MNITTFTASRIAVALGKTKRAVQLALHETKPGGREVVKKGQQTYAWRIDQLPLRFVAELQSIADSRGYRNVEHLLGQPARRWTPGDKHGVAVPLNEISTNQIERASRLLSALAMSIQLKDQLEQGEQRGAALTAFRRHYGNASERHWRRMLKRTIQRDAGEQRFDYLALYVDEVVTRKPEARDKIAVGRTAAERTVLDELAMVKNLAKPTLDESALIWTVACEFIADAVEQSGEKQKRAQHRIFELLSNSRVVLARTDDALKRQIPRKFDEWNKRGRTLAALLDHRPISSGKWAPKISDADRHKLIGHARINCGGRLSQAYRDLLHNGQLSPGLTSRFVDNPTSTSYVPNRIRKAVSPDVNRIAAYHLGPREHKMRGPYHTRDWSVVSAGDWMQADDCTNPVYWYKQRECGGGELTRGQFLPMIDERTTMILGFVLIQEKNYNSLSIRALITEVCSEHGLPRVGFSFERGIWKSSKILTGDRNAEVADAADTGLRRLGLRFRHAALPRGKVIERTLGQLQDLMEALPGYCGRNEILERHERFQRAKLDVEAGRAEARDHFLSAEEIRDRFAAIVDRYNDTPQQGAKLIGLSPREGWERLQGCEPLTRFHAATLYFLASDVRKLKVGRNGVTLTVGKRRFNYKDGNTGERQGETIYGWFNAQRPDSLPCTSDLSGKGLFVVERSCELPAVGASRELLASENAKAAAHRSYGADLYYIVKNALPPSTFRGQTLDSKGLQLGEAIETHRKEITARHRADERLERDITRKAKQVGIHPSLVKRSPGTLDRLDRYAAFSAELERGIKEEKANP